MRPVSSKERVMTAVARREPDMVPMDFSANSATLQRLMSHFNCKDHYALLKRLGSDIVDLRGVVDPVYRGPIPKERQLAGGVKENYWGWRTKIEQTATGPEEMFCEFVLAGRGIEEIKKHTWPRVDWFDFTDFRQRLEPWSEFAVMASGPSVWQHPSFLRGLDGLMMDLATEDEAGDYIMDQFTDFYTAYFDAMFSAAPGRIDILRIADDLGMQDRLIMSREMLLHFVRPRIKKIIDMAHAHNVKVMFHSCGAIFDIIEDLISAGVDILDPIQVTAKGMDPALLKEKFGAEICFHGAIDTQHLLPHGSPEEIRGQALSMIEVLGRGGGYILSPSHVLQTDVPTENILALYETRHLLSGK